MSASIQDGSSAFLVEPSVDFECEMCETRHRRYILLRVSEDESREVYESSTQERPFLEPHRRAVLIPSAVTTACQEAGKKVNACRWRKGLVRDGYQGLDVGQGCSSIPSPLSSMPNSNQCFNCCGTAAVIRQVVIVATSRHD